MEKWQSVDAKFEFIKTIFNVDKRIERFETINGENNEDGLDADKQNNFGFLDQNQPGKWRKKCGRFCDQFGILIFSSVFFTLYVVSFFNLLLHPKCYAQTGNLIPMFKDEEAMNEF